MELELRFFATDAVMILRDCFVSVLERVIATIFSVLDEKEVLRDAKFVNVVVPTWVPTSIAGYVSVLVYYN